MKYVKYLLAALLILLTLSACAKAGEAPFSESVPKPGLTSEADSPARAAAKATTMRLEDLEGDLSVTDGDGEIVAPRVKMRLRSGYLLDTLAASYAWISLDKTKAVKTDENSSVSVSQEGLRLELALERGALYFSVSQPLEEEESFEIRTSTMVLGIRGTSGYVCAEDDDTSVIILTSGKALITAQSGETQAVSSGERVTVRAEKKKTKFDVEDIRPADYPAFLLEALAEDDEMLAEAEEQNGEDFPDEMAEALTFQALADGDYSAFAGTYRPYNANNYRDLVLYDDGRITGGGPDYSNGGNIFNGGVPVSVTREEGGAYRCIVVPSDGTNMEYFILYPAGVSDENPRLSGNAELTESVFIKYLRFDGGVFEQRYILR